MAIGEAHNCEWRDEAERLRSENTDLKDRLGGIEHQLAALQRAVFGKKSEKLPRIEEQFRGDEPKPREETLKERRAKRAARAELPEREIRHEVPAAKRRCPKCGSGDLRPLGPGKQTIV